MARLKRWRTKLLVALAGVLGLFFWRGPGNSFSEVKAFVEPVIQHSAIECIPNNRHAIATAVIEPGDEIQGARIYFRSNKYPDFYYVEMHRKVDAQGSVAMQADGGDFQEGNNEFQAILPIPSEETDTVIYYVEAVSVSYDVGRTGEYDPFVADDGECRRRDPLAAWFTGDNPGIVVGATVAGASSLPPGFQAAGITGFISAAGIASGTGGGGIGAAGVAAIAAGGAAGAAAIAVAGGGDGDSTTTTTAAGGPATSTTAPGTTTTTAAGSNPAPVACFTIDPPSAEVEVGEMVRLDARCSKGDPTGEGDAISNYEWDLGDGRIRSGPDLAFITPRWNTPGVYTVILNVTDSGGAALRAESGARLNNPLTSSVSHEITVKAAPRSIQACFDASAISCCCNMRFDASCSTGPIDGYEWVLDAGGVFGPPVRESGRIVTHDWDCGLGAPIVAQLMVRGEDGNTDSVSQTVMVPYFPSLTLRTMTVSTTFTSYLGVQPFDGSARAQVLVNGSSSQDTDSSTPFQHHVQGRLGHNAIEAYTTTPMEQPGFLRFEFSGSPNFVTGSIKVQSGQVISISASTAVFRLAGTTGERIKFTFQLVP